MRTPKLTELFKEIRDNKLAIESGNMDAYELIGKLSKKYFSKIDPLHGKRTSNMHDPYTDIIFACFDILEIRY